MELLEREITALASQIHAATCRWLELVAEYDAREGWAQWGCRSCAHWVSWQCGIAPGPAREHVRVARRLGELPLIRASFRAGELSYSKVRALTRVENVEREAELLDLARHATASQLERLLRAYRGVVAAERAAVDGRPARWLVVDHDDDGSVLVRGRFPAHEGALIVAALQAAQDDVTRSDVADRPFEVERGSHVSAGTPAEAADPGPGGFAGTPAEASEPRSGVGAGTSAGTGESDRDIPARTPQAAGEAERDVPARTPQAAGEAERDVPAGTSDESPQAGHGVAAGTSATTNARVPAATRDASSDRRQGISAGPPLVSVSEARAEALLALADDFLAGRRGARTGGDRYQVLVHVDAAALSGAEQAGRCELGDGVPLSTETARRLACDASIVRLLERDGRPLTVGRKTRTITPGLRRALDARDRGCRFPGCTARRFIDAHHIEHWARGGTTDLHNLVQLCSAHHRLVHEEGYGIRRLPGGVLRFHRPDGRPIPECPSPPGASRPRLQPTRRPDACVPLSRDRLDLGLAVDAMLTFAPPDNGEPPGV